MPLFNSQLFNSNLGNNQMFNQNMGFANQGLMNEALEIKRHYENSPNDLQYILHQNPEFAQAVLSDDINVLMNLLAKIVNILR